MRGHLGHLPCSNSNSLLHWLMTITSLLEFFQWQGSFCVGSQPNENHLLRKMNVELQILTVFFSVLMSSGAGRSHRVKTGVTNKVGGRRTEKEKKEKKLNYQKRQWQRNRDKKPHSPCCSCLVFYFCLFLRPSTFQFSMFGFKYFKSVPFGMAAF